jgi:hypothetical protein
VIHIKLFNNKSGSTTVFLSIILSICIVTTGILCDSLRIKSVSGKLTRNVISAGNSVLALYNSILKEDYGLFALGITDKVELDSIFDYYLESNISSKTRLFDIDSEKLSVSPIFNLTENEVTKSQILEHMKYKAPEILTQNFLDKIKVFKDGSKVTESLVKKGEIERDLVKEIPAVEDFYKALNGDSNSTSYAVNNFSIDTITQLAKDNSINEVKKAVNEFKEANLNTLNKLNNIISTSNNIVSKADEVLNGINNIKDSYESFADGELSLEKTLEGNLGNLKSILSSKDDSDNIAKKLSDNISYLDNFNSVLSSSNSDDILIFIQNNLNAYDNKILSENNNESNNKLKDPRKASEDTTKNYIKNENVNNDINFINSKININELPSNQKIISLDFSSKDHEFLNSNKIDVINEELISDDTNLSFPNLEAFADQIEFSNESENGFSNNAFSFFSSLQNIVGDVNNLTVNFRNNVYINEFIIDKFKSNISKPNNIKETFFQNEIEYVLQGNQSQQKNLLQTKNEILLMRFFLNTIHIYSDPEKIALANEIAVAISSWWSLGIAVPIISTLIICSWAMIESTVDTQDLLDGKSVPFYKLKDDWKTEIDGVIKSVSNKIDNSSKSKGNIDFNYNDYLRILLLLRSSDQKLNRIEDLIELNMQKKLPGFKLNKCNTELRIESEFSLNYLFITQIFIPEKYKIGKRQKLKNLRYVGYI